MRLTLNSTVSAASPPAVPGQYYTSPLRIKTPIETILHIQKTQIIITMSVTTQTGCHKSVGAKIQCCNECSPCAISNRRKVDTEQKFSHNPFAVNYRIFSLTPNLRLGTSGISVGIMVRSNYNTMGFIHEIYI